MDGLTAKIIWRIICAAALFTGPCSAWAVDTNQPLPTVEEILTRVVERARRERLNDREFASQYSFVKSRTTEYRNGKGEVKKQEARISTNHPALKELALSSLGKSEDQDQAVAERQRQTRAKAYETDEFQMNQDLVQRFEFKLLNREILNGRPTLVLEFQPANGPLPERNLKDKFINKAAGRLWINEGDYAIVKATVRLTDRINVLGGLVGAIRKFTLEFERERVEETLWFTRLTTWHLEGREVFAQRVIDFREERSEVHKPASEAGLAAQSGR